MTPSSLTRVPAYAAWDFRRTARMVESTLFVVALPTALYLMFGAITSYADTDAGNGNVAAYNMTSMATYGAVVATTSIAGSAAVERMKGWGRQLAMTSLTTRGYFLGKVCVALGMAVLATAVVMGVGALTGARLDSLGHWAATFGLVVLSSLTFALYGLAAALLFRSEAAVSAASGGLVVLGFLGNLFVPLSGGLLAFARFTPMYGAGALARWPQLEGAVMDTSAGLTQEPLWFVLANVIGWAAVFAVVCLAAARRSTAR